MIPEKLETLRLRPDYCVDFPWVRVGKGSACSHQPDKKNFKCMMHCIEQSEGSYLGLENFTVPEISNLGQIKKIHKAIRHPTS